MASEMKRPAMGQVLREREPKRARTDEYFPRSKRVAFDVKEADGSKKRYEVYMTEELAGICHTLFQSGVYFISNSMSYGEPTFQWCIEEAQLLGFKFTYKVFKAFFRVS